MHMNEFAHAVALSMHRSTEAGESVSVASGLACAAKSSKKARGALLSGTMLLSGGLVLLSSALMSGSAFARCVNTTTGVEIIGNTGQPTTGQSVVCDTTAPNPTTNGVVVAAGNTGVTITVNSGASLTTSSGSGAIYVGQAITGMDTTANLINNGTIEASVGAGVNFARSTFGGTITNNGIIRSTASAGLSSSSNDIINGVNGQIIGVNGISASSGTITNYGLIQGTSNRAITAPIAGATSSNVIINYGIIQGVANGGSVVRLNDGDDVFISAGESQVIGGAVDGTGGSDTFKFQRTSATTITHGITTFDILRQQGADVLLDTDVALEGFSQTFVEAGKLGIAVTRTLTTGRVAMSAGTTLEVLGTLTAATSGFTAITGSTGNETLIVNGVMRATANLDDGDDTLILRDSASIDTGVGFINGGTGTNTVIADISGSVTPGFMGSITNFQNLVKQGVGTFNLGTASYTNVDVQVGTLAMTGALTSSITNVAAGATLSLTAGLSGTAGDDTFTSAGTVTGTLVDLGAGANTFTITDGVVSTALQSGAGIDTFNLSGGTVSGAVNLGDGDNIFNVTGGTANPLQGGAGNDTLNLSAGSVLGTVNLGEGANTFTITGGEASALQSGAGNDTFTLSAGRVNGTVDLGDGANTFDITGGSVGGLVSAGAGADIFNWVGGGTLESGFQLGGGNDKALLKDLTEANMVPGAVYDGGLGTDSLVFDNVVTTGVSGYKNWESIELTNGSKLTFASTLTLGDSGTGTGSLSVDSTSTIFAGNGTHAIAPFTAGQLVNVTNAGTIDLTNGPLSTSDRLTITGNYTGQNGTLRLNTVLAGDNAPSDRLVIDGGTASGATTISVINAGGAGAPTTNGILVVSAINGATTSAGAFTLAGDYVTPQGEQAIVAGAYAYTLRQNGVTTPNDGSWYLRSSLTNPVDPVNPIDPSRPVNPGAPLYQAGVPVYESYAQNLAMFNAMPTMQQRIGDRYAMEGASVQGQPDALCRSASVTFKCPVVAVKGGFAPEKAAIWTRAEISRSRIEPSASTAGATSDSDLWKLQSGIDGTVAQYKDGTRLMGGLTAHYGQVSSDISSVYGRGGINTTGYGFGGTLTWFNPTGVYVDAQASATWFDSDLKSDTAGRNLVKGNNGFGYAFSVESGKKIALNDKWALTPQAQLTYGNVRFDRFVDVFGAAVSRDSGDNLRGRLGLSADWQDSWKDASGQIQRGRIYGIANVYYDFLDPYKVNVADTVFKQSPGKTWGGLGLGGSYSWNNDMYSVYGEVNAQTALNSFGDSYVLNGTLGVRVKW